MSGTRRILFLTLSGLILFSLSGLPAWLHMSHAEHGHADHNCVKCQVLRDHAAVGPGPAVDHEPAHDEVTFRVIEFHGITAPAVCCALPPSRAPPVLS